jgi:hypothetical protein
MSWIRVFKGLSVVCRSMFACVHKHLRYLLQISKHDCNLLLWLCRRRTGC